MRAYAKACAIAAAVAMAACNGSTGVFTTTGLGDGTTAEIVGAVTADGVPRSGVQVVAVGVGTQRDSALTNAAGAYRIAGLTPGSYSVSVQVPLGLELAPGQVGTQSLTLAAGSFATASFALQRTAGAP